MSDWPDVEGALRAHLRADAGVAALVGARVFFAIPSDARAASYPLVTVSRIGGGQSPTSDAPLDLALVSIDVWGAERDKAAATAVVNAVRSTLEEINGRTTLTADVDAFGVQVAGVVWAPDPDNGRPHYAITAEVTAISS